LRHVSEHQIHATIDAVWRIESAKLIAGLTRMVRDVGLAEDLAQDALLAALDTWPTSGIPDNPGAWLMATARRRGIDQLRRAKVLTRTHDVLGRELDASRDAQVDALSDRLDDDIGDELLGLLFMTCHPALPTDARVALTLRLVGSLTTDEIARAFLVPEPTIAQRIVRAKKALREVRAAFDMPRGDALAERLASVLDVIYLIFNEGYAATAGDDWMRPELCDEAMRLGRVTAGLMPGTAEVHGLVALMELQASRIRARTGPAGDAILLLDQDRSRWDQLLIRRGLAALERARSLASLPGSYTLQAAIAACHARALTPDATDWVQIADLYASLAELIPSPVVELNRAVAVGMAYGPAAGLELTDALQSHEKMQAYHLLPAVRGDLLARLGRRDEARGEFERAAALTRNVREREVLRRRAREQ